MNNPKDKKKKLNIGFLKSNLTKMAHTKGEGHTSSETIFSTPKEWNGFVWLEASIARLK